MVDDLRYGAVDADRSVARVVDRILRRRRDGACRRSTTPVPSRERRPARRGPGFQGSRARIVSRSVAAVIDFGVAVVAAFVLVLMRSVWSFFTSAARACRIEWPSRLGLSSLVWVVLFVYLAWGWGRTGKTIGKRVLGLTVVTTGAACCPRGWPSPARRSTRCSPSACCGARSAHASAPCRTSSFARRSCTTGGVPGGGGLPESTSTTLRPAPLVPRVP